MEHLDRLKRNGFVILKNLASFGLMSKVKRKASQNEFMEKGRMPDRVKSFGKINNIENRSRARPGFVKPNGNGLRKEQNLIQSRTVQGRNRPCREKEWNETPEGRVGKIE